VGVYQSMKDAEAAVATLLEHRAPAEQVSIAGQDLHSKTCIPGLVTTGDVATRGAQTGAWVGDLFGVLSAATLRFVPGVGALVVLGPLAVRIGFMDTVAQRLFLLPDRTPRRGGRWADHRMVINGVFWRARTDCP
jgi:hypothetical protein